jgi:hypothetical protein
MGRYSNSVPQILDENGDPIVGAKKYFFEPGSSTLKTIYSDSELSLPTVNPVVSDSAGRFQDIFLDGTYKEVQEDENGVTLWSRDPVGVDTTGEWTLWDAGATYSIPQIVLGSDDKYYRSLVDSNIGNDPTSSPASWEQLYLGRIWNANVTYSITDTVYGSDGYIYKSQINSNLNNDPTTDNVNWWPGSPEHLSVSAAGTNTYTATYGETAYKSGRRYYLNFTNANTSSAPTINLDSIGAKTIKKNGGLALVAGDIPAGHRAILEYDGTDQILLNPKVPIPADVGLASVQVFTSSGTWTKPANITRVTVWVVGGGGGGGGGNNALPAPGCGGGGGGTAIELIDVTGTASETVTVGAAGAAGGAAGAGGAGGTSSFGAFCSATGGAGGGFNNGDGGDGGAGTGGDINLTGGGGTAGGETITSGVGGTSFLSGGGAGQYTIAAANPGGNYGGGGSGSSSAATKVGAAGAAGVVIVWEYK